MQLRVGQRSESECEVTDALVREFARLSGDFNPVHLDDEYARSTPFRRRIAHGMLPGSLISGLLGTTLPGPGSIYLSQKLEFLAPVYVGDSITVEVEVIDVREDKPVITLSTSVFTERGQAVRGEAVLLVPRER